MDKTSPMNKEKDPVKAPFEGDESWYFDLPCEKRTASRCRMPPHSHVWQKSSRMTLSSHIAKYLDQQESRHPQEAWFSMTDIQPPLP